MAPADVPADGSTRQRNLADWFLVRPLSPSSSPPPTPPPPDTFLPREPLPIGPDGRPGGLAGYQLHGDLVPPPRGRRRPLPPSPAFGPVILSDCVDWYIELGQFGSDGDGAGGEGGGSPGTAPRTRGIFVRVRDGTTYRLLWADERPVSHPPSSPDQLVEEDGEWAHPSQAYVHLPLRCRFGLLSNLADLFWEPYEDTDGNYVPVHARRSPANIHALLTPSAEVYRSSRKGEVDVDGNGVIDDGEAKPLNREPFDLELLNLCPGFVRSHMLGHHPLLHDNCAFIKRLAEAEAEAKARLQAADVEDERAFTDDDCLTSALSAEDRGQRTSWGESLPRGRPVRPNRLIDIEIRAAARDAAIGYRSGTVSGSGGNVVSSQTSQTSPSQALPGGIKIEEGGGICEEDDGHEVPEEGEASEPVETTTTAAALQVLERSIDEEAQEEVQDEARKEARRQDVQVASVGRDTGKMALGGTDTGQGGSGTPRLGHSLSTGRQATPANQSTRHRERASPPSGPTPQNPLPYYGQGPASEQRAPLYPPIYLMTSSGRATYSGRSMVQALRFYAMYLSPTPQDDHLSLWVEFKDFSVRDDMLTAFLDAVIMNPSVLSMEAMLLGASSYGRKHTEQALYHLLDRGAAKKVFGVWLGFIDRTIRMELEMGLGPRRSWEKKNQAKDRTEVMILLAIMEMLSRFSEYITSPRHIADLSTSCGVGLIEICDKVSSRRSSDLLRDAHYFRALLTLYFCLYSFVIPQTLATAQRQNFEELALICSNLRRKLGSISSSNVGAASKSLLHCLRVPEASSDIMGTGRRNEMISAGPQGRPAVSLPTLSKGWMLANSEQRFCTIFSEKNECLNGIRCRYAHVYSPPEQLLLRAEVPSESVLHFIYVHDRRQPLQPTDFHLLPVRDQDNKVWHCASFLCPLDKIFYIAQGGPSSCVNSQGIHFYPSVHDAMAALSGVVISALRKNTSLQISDYYHFDCRHDTPTGAPISQMNGTRHLKPSDVPEEASRALGELIKKKNKEDKQREEDKRRALELLAKKKEEATADRVTKTAEDVRKKKEREAEEKAQKVAEGKRKQQLMEKRRKEEEARKKKEADVLAALPGKAKKRKRKPATSQGDAEDLEGPRIPKKSRQKSPKAAKDQANDSSKVTLDLELAAEALASGQQKMERCQQWESTVRSGPLLAVPCRRMTYLHQKSLFQPSSGIRVSSTSAADAGENSSEKDAVLPYWDTLGSCRLDPSQFECPPQGRGILGFDKEMGRVYYSSFIFHGQKVNVGDYFVRTQYDADDLIRVVGAFQATRSFVGDWVADANWGAVSNQQEIQKRGHPYLLFLSLIPSKSKQRKGGSSASSKGSGGGGEKEVLLDAEHGVHVFPLPTWLGEDMSLRSVSVRVVCNFAGKLMEEVVGHSGSGKRKGGRRRSGAFGRDAFVCHKAYLPEHGSIAFDLDDDIFSLLTDPPEVLAARHIADRWDDRFDAVQVQMTSVAHPRFKPCDQYGPGREVAFSMCEASSDDSDGFDEVSQVHIDASKSDTDT